MQAPVGHLWVTCVTCGAPVCHRPRLLGGEPPLWPLAGSRSRLPRAQEVPSSETSPAWAAARGTALPRGWDTDIPTRSPEGLSPDPVVAAQKPASQFPV